MFQKILCVILSCCLLPLPQAHASEGLLSLPVPGTMVHLSAPLNPSILKGIKVHTDDPFKFEFVLDQGTVETPFMASHTSLQDESKKLIKYFLAALTTPEKDLWVNLSPYEKDRIVPESFGQTEMGRDLLAQDYLLKQLTASLIYPEGDIGKVFWKRVYEESATKHGGRLLNVPISTFNKVWIVPSKAVVYENAKAGTAYVVESSLKVMLEEDYLAVEKNRSQPGDISRRDVLPSLMPSKEGLNVQASQGNPRAHSQTSQIIKDIVIPQLTKEVNEGTNFAQLRQIYNSLILATWYKKKIQDSILTQVYANKNKVNGVDYNDALEPQLIYERYLEAFKKGAYNYIKEELDPITHQKNPRKYFSGGMHMDMAMMRISSDKNLMPINDNHQFIAQVNLVTADHAMAAVRVSQKKYFESLMNKSETIDITEFLGSLAPYGQFNDAFAFELNGFKPGKVAIGIGYGKTNDIILMEVKPNIRTFKRMREGEIVSSSIWVKTESKDEKMGGMVWEKIQKQEKRRMDDPVRSLEDFHANIEETYKDSPGTIGLAKLIFEVGKLQINKEKIGSLVGKSLRPTNSDGSSTFSLFEGHVKIPVLGKTDHQYIWHPVILHERMVGDIYEFTVRSTASTFMPIDRTFRIGDKTKDIIWRGENKKIYVFEPVDQIPMRTIQKQIKAHSAINVKSAVEELRLIAGQSVDVTEDTGQIRIFLGNGDFYRWAVLGMTQGGWNARVLGARESDTKDSVILSMVLTKENGTHIIKVFEFGKKMAISEKGMKYYVMESKIFDSFEDAFNEGGRMLRKYPKRLSLDMMGNTTIIFSNGKRRSNAYVVTYKNGDYERAFGKKNHVVHGSSIINTITLPGEDEKIEEQVDMAMGSDDFPPPGNKTRVNELKVEAHQWLVPLLRRESGNLLEFEELAKMAKDKKFYLGKLSAGKIVLPVYEDKDYTRQLLDTSFSKRSDERSGWETWLSNVRMDHGSIRFDFVLIKREIIDGVEKQRKIVEEYVINPYITRDVFKNNGKKVEVLEIVKAEDYPGRLLSVFMLRPKDFHQLEPMMLALQGSTFGFTHSAGEVLFAVPNKAYPEKNLFLISKTLGVKDMTQWKAVIKQVKFQGHVMDLVFGVSKDDVILPDVIFQASPALQETLVNIHDDNKTLDVMTLDKRLAVRGLEKFSFFDGDANELKRSGFSLKGMSFGEVNAAGSVSITPKSGRTFAVPISGIKESGPRGEIIDEEIYQQENKIYYAFTTVVQKEGSFPFVRKFVASKDVGDVSVDTFKITPVEYKDMKDALHMMFNHLENLDNLEIHVTSSQDPKLRIGNKKFGSNFYLIHLKGLLPGVYHVTVREKRDNRGQFILTMRKDQTEVLYDFDVNQFLDLETYKMPMSMDKALDNELEKFRNDFLKRHPHNRVHHVYQDKQKLRMYWEDEKGAIHRAIVTDNFIKSLGYDNIKFYELDANGKEFALVKLALDKNSKPSKAEYLKAQAEDNFPQEYQRNKVNLGRFYPATSAVMGISQLMFEGISTKESSDVAQTLVGKSLPKTDKNGRSIFSIFPQTSVSLYVLGKAEAEWQPVITRVDKNELGFYEITVRSTKEGQLPVEKTFEIGRFKKKVTWHGYKIPIYSIVPSERIRLYILRNIMLKKNMFKPVQVRALLNQLKGVVLGPSLDGGHINIYLTHNRKMPWYFASQAGQSMRILDARINEANDAVMVTVLVWHVTGAYQIRIFELGKKVVTLRKGLEYYAFKPVGMLNITEAFIKVGPIISALEKPLERDPMLGNVILEFPDVINGEKMKVIHNGEYFTLFHKNEQEYKDRMLEHFRKIIQDASVQEFINSDTYNALPLNRKLGAFIEFLRSNGYTRLGHMGQIWRTLQKLEDEDINHPLDWGNIGGYSIVRRDYQRLVELLEQKDVHRFIYQVIVKGHLEQQSTLKIFHQYLMQKFPKFFDRIPLMDLYLAIPMQYRSYFTRPDAAQVSTGGIDLTSEKMNVETKLNNNQPIAFHLDPAQFAQFQNASGFTPVIVSIMPLADLHTFLSIK